MKIAVLNGSPRVGNTAAMVDAFAEGAKEAGHEVEILHVGRMKIGGCMGCEYCHGKGAGTCIQRDDMDKVMPAYREADMIVYVHVGVCTSTCFVTHIQSPQRSTP